MTPAQLWQDIGAGENAFARFLRLLFLLVAGAVFCFLAILPLTWPQQVVLGVATLLTALFMARGSDSYLATLTLMMMSVFCTLRYGYWRIEQVVHFFRNPANHWGGVDVFFILCLLIAESYAFLVLFLGYFQTIWPLRRAPVPMPEDTDEWPHIDVLIPTFDEPLDVVRFTALGALNMDWPVDKLHVYLLDDGRRPEFEQFAFLAGVGYKTRENNEHAKAGNINAALKTLSSPFVVVFDSDHVPTRSFLQMTVGWFLRDRKLAVLQTPHHFYSPDPFERNLNQFRIIPNEGELFYGIVQDGNDFWNASFFCGSCAVLRRSALDDVGGIAEETVTEDAHTSLRMQMNGWNSAYVNIPQAAGLATERLSAHVRQRIRWARGMVQILRRENPLFVPGLSFPQRLCYFNAMCHFLYAVPRLIFLTAPLIFLLLNRTNIPGYWAAILAYAVPHLALLVITNSRIQGEHRFSFWNEIYETVLSPYILLPTLLALVNPRWGKFNVTAKGNVVKRTFFDAKIAKPFLVMLLFNVAGLAMAVPRFLVWNKDRPGTVAINVAWCLFNLIILGVCTAVARELKQLRSSVRISVVTPVKAKLPDGRVVAGETMNLSSGGTSIRFGEALDVAPQTEVRLEFPAPASSSDLPAIVVSSDGSVLRAHFGNLTIAEQEVLTMVLYSRADSWLGWGEARESDKALNSLWRVFKLSMRGLAAALGSFTVREDDTIRKSKSLSVTTSAGIVALAGLLAMGPRCLHAQAEVPPAVRPPVVLPAAQTVATRTAAAGQGTGQAPAIAPGHYEDRFTLGDAGAPLMDLHGIDSIQKVNFTLPETHIVRLARIHVYYAFSPALLPQLSHIKLLLNGKLLATVQPTAAPSGGSDSKESEAEFPIPPELMTHNNTLAIEFIGHSTQDCEDPASTALWARVHRTSYFDIRGDLQAPATDLKNLPMPFVDPSVVQDARISVVFPSQPSYKAIQAAGVLTSYFGMVSENRAMRFPVHIGDIPQGNAIVVAENAASLPASLGMREVIAPTVALRTNPNDPFGKVLVVTGADADQALTAAQAVALQSDMLSGAESTALAVRPPVRLPDDAPRWARTDQKIQLGSLATAEQLQGDGSEPLNVHFRIPPDIFYADQPNALLRLGYRYNSVPIGPMSSMQVRVNDTYIDSVPLAPGQDASRATQQNLPVPIVNLRPFLNTLSFDFTFQLQKAGCKDTTPDNTQGAILGDSYLDLTGYQHYTSMPNLEIFANAGFPFTRMADLGETAVVLPPTPTAQEIELFLTLLGHFGRQTGFPALRVTVAGADALRNGSANDFLVLATGDDQPGFGALGDKLPVSVSGGQIQVHDTQGFFISLLHKAWWKAKSDGHTESGDLTASGTPDALIEGIQSPFAPGQNRSLVAIYLKDASEFEPFIDTFLKVQQSSDIAGSVSVLHGTQFRSFRIGAHLYHVGELPWWLKAQLWLKQLPWIIPSIVVVLAFLLAVWTRQWLRARARKRLKMIES